MSPVDYIIFGVYLAGVLCVGVYFYRKNESTEDYFVGKRSVKAHHVGLSIAATDVGGGFSIGLGGVGFLMGLSGSWLLFTGLLGAWLTAVLIIPRVKRVDAEFGLMTYPDFLRLCYGDRVALLAAVISGVGYLGFTGAQILAGAKLAAATILPAAPLGMDATRFALLVIAAITILYTVFGGLKAVIYTDTVQWTVLIGGLVLVTIPVTLHRLGGWEALTAALPATHFSLAHIGAIKLINWMVTIVPIWFVGMTLYQRMYACRNEKEAKRAWYIAGVFEYPVMAFTGVFLGMCARVAFPEAEPETAMPLLIKTVLPAGVTGIVIAAYFSAIMSTADSCLMAASGNLTGDVLERHVLKKLSPRQAMRLSMLVTFVIGGAAVLLAARFETVLDAILHAYAFMVAGLFVPTLGAFFWRRGSAAGAFVAMLGGGALTLLLLSETVTLPGPVSAVGLDPAIFGIAFSAILYILVSLIFPNRREPV